ncbi:dihydropteroate synthase [bacterium]|nr:dihydropteroate synthase [bacterium]
MLPTHLAYLALGSNLGDRAANLYAALDALKHIGEIEDTAFLYETPPAYVLDQPPFLNSVCSLRTDLTPHELLSACKEIERNIGRTETIRFGPRTIDIDILFFDNLIVETEALTIPHPRLAERDFVLEPLCDLAPNLRHLQLGETMQTLWQRLKRDPLPRVMPVGKKLWHWGARTYVMGILNITPDSFSGDGLLHRNDRWIEQAVTQAERFAAAGVDVVDVGGYSTRPNHEDIPVEEEIRRVMPVIQSLRERIELPISIDTFRPAVAAAALDAGAQWINDVWGLRLFPELADLAVQRHAPLVIVHNRTRPLAAYAERLRVGGAAVDAGITEVIQQELAQSVVLAQKAGLPRWLRILDPGIGFGKTLDEHLALIKQLSEVRIGSYPLLFGASRKGFIGKVLGGVAADQRMAGTLALNVLAAERGADIVRVHDVEATVHAMRMTDAVLRLHR